jgi:lipopolysaccharide/colanic/teichoic acid biosynthesis glycosyltransferase
MAANRRPRLFPAGFWMRNRLRLFWPPTPIRSRALRGITKSGGHRPNLALGAKRLLDVTLGIAVGAVALPLMVAIGVAILIDSPGPVLFRPTRVGRRGKHFTMYKFRTMVKGADGRLHEVAHLNVADGMVKIPHDPRVTRMGRWLRRFSLDELPQIYNVISGHMSLVGPRPHDVHELANVDLAQEPRLAMRPGLTGLWQVHARSDPSLASRVHHDLNYVNGWSLLLDAKILAKTVPVVVLGKGGSVDGARQTAADREAFLSRTATQGPAHSGPGTASIAGRVDVAPVAVGEESR